MSTHSFAQSQRVLALSCCKVLTSCYVPEAVLVLPAIQYMARAWTLLPGKQHPHLWCLQGEAQSQESPVPHYYLRDPNTEWMSLTIPKSCWVSSVDLSQSSAQHAPLQAVMHLSMHLARHVMLAIWQECRAAAGLLPS